MGGPGAICSSCGAMGNPHGIPAPPHMKPLIGEVLESRRKTGGPVLLVYAPTISRAFVLRVMREQGNATEAEIEGITFAIPDNLPRGMAFKTAFIDPDVNDPKVKEWVETCLERPPGPSIWERIRNPMG